MDDIFSDIKEDGEKETDSNIEWKKSGIDKHERLTLKINVKEANLYSASKPNELKDKRKTKYQDADRRYGHKLYSRVGKSIGLIVPRRGGKARFVLTDKLLRFFVLSLVPTQRMTLERFKNNIANHFGFVFDESALAQSPDWQDRKEQLDLNAADSMFLERMLEASGMLITLSDSCSLVKNPFCKGDEK